MARVAGYEGSIGSFCEDFNGYGGCWTDWEKRFRGSKKQKTKIIEIKCYMKICLAKGLLKYERENLPSMLAETNLLPSGPINDG